MTPQPSTKIELVSPFPPELYQEFYDWTFQFPERTMDDFWKKEFDSFCHELTRRGKEEYTCAVIENGVPVGFIGFMRLTPHVGTLRGVCFTKEVHGNGTAVRALRSVLQQHFDEGVHKIMAFPFWDNLRARAFYKKIGAVDEQFLREHTLRGGKLTDMSMLSFFASADGYRVSQEKT